MHVITETRCLGYRQRGHPELPERVGRTIERLRVQNDLPITWDEPLDPDDAVLLRAHAPELLRRLEEPWDFDADTPYYPDIHIYARRAVGGALCALNHALAGRYAFSLMRPPGHHATRTRCMGFCYLNSAAVTALEACARGLGRVAIFDIDAHHGNGTEEIVHGHPGIIYISVHQHPCFPGTGTAHREPNCFNFPVQPGLARAEYLAVLDRAFARLYEADPALVIVSAGFDTYKHDPLTQLPLEIEDFYQTGRLLRGLNRPVVAVLEGGYSLDLPCLILEFMKGLSGA